MTKENLEQLLVDYGVSFTSALADKLLQEFNPEICEDAISRQAAIIEIRLGQSYITKISPTGELEHLYEAENNALEKAVERIEDLPSVIPSRQTGRWKRNETIRLTYCSECGFGKHIDEFRTYHYCPNCGAKMESEE